MIQVPRSIGVVLFVMAFLMLRLTGGGAAAVAVPQEPAKEQKGQPKLRHDLADAQKTIRAVAFSRDGKTLATVGAGIKLWDMATGKEKTAFAKGHDGIVMAVAFSPDDKTLITAGMDVTVRLWDVETGKEKPAPKGFGKGSFQEYLCLVASRDGKTVAAAGLGNGVIFSWNVATGKRKDLIEHINHIYALSLSRDGKLLASGSSDSSCKVWDLTTGKMKANLEDKDCWGTIPSLALSPDGATLATWRPKGDVKLWNIATGKVKGTLKSGWGIYCLAFSPDGKTVAAKTEAGVYLWDVESGKLEATLKESGGVFNNLPCPCLAFSLDGKLLALGADKNIKVWELDAGK